MKLASLVSTVPTALLLLLAGNAFGTTADMSSSYTAIAMETTGATGSTLIIESPIKDRGLQDKNEDEEDGEMTPPPPEAAPAELPEDFNNTAVPEGEQEGGAEEEEQGMEEEGGKVNDGVVRTSIVRLVPFQVQLAMTGDPEKVDPMALRDLVQQWMTDSFIAKAEPRGLLDPNCTLFTSLGLEIPDENDRRSSRSLIHLDGAAAGGSGGLRGGRNLQDEQQQEEGTSNVPTVFIETYEGVTVWQLVGSDTPAVDPDVVEVMLQDTLLEENTLLEKLREAEESSTGLGTNVADVKAFMFVSGDDSSSSASDGGSGGSDDDDDGKNGTIEIIIIIAIVVACMAFGLLVFAVIWAWRSDRDRRGGGYGAGSGSGRDSTNYDSRTKHRTIPAVPTKSESYDLSPSAVAVPISPPAATTPNNKNTYSRQAQPVASKKIYDTSVRKSTTTMTKTKSAPPVAKAIPAVPTPEPMSVQNSSTTGTNEEYIGDASVFSELPPPPRDYDESVISEDISTSLTAYYRSGMAGYSTGGSGGRKGTGNYQHHHTTAHHAGGGGDLDDNASLSSMDSYGFSLDGYAPSLGPAPTGYPMGAGSSLYNSTVKDPETDYSEEEAEDFSNMNMK